MKHCDQCGTKVNFDAKFCQNCGAELNSSSIVNKTIDANLKVDLTNKTTEKILNDFATVLSSGVSWVKKATKVFLRILWRIIKVAVVIGIVSFVAFQLYEHNEKEKAAQKQQAKIENAAQVRRTKIKNAKRWNKKWAVYGTLDPASKKKIARTASITSKNGLCELTVQQRINGNKLTGIDCMDIVISEFDDIYIKFDKDKLSTRMNLKSYSDSDDVYISYNQFTYSGYMSYEKFINGLVSNNVVAIKIPNNTGNFWVSFSLKGSTEAINKLGKEIK